MWVLQYCSTVALSVTRSVCIVLCNLASALFEGEERSLRDLAMNDSKLWAFNGQIGGYDVNLADVNLGDIVSLRVWNDSAWPHAMHLHGQHFWVKSREFGQEEKALLRDTYLMQPGEKKDLVFIAENPGLWLFHCHMLVVHSSQTTSEICKIKTPG